MRRRTIAWVVGLVGVAALALPSFATAQENAIPDFAGLWARSATAGGRTFDPPASGPGPVMVVPDANGFRIGDYTNPILLPHAAAAVKAHGDLGRAGEVALPAWSLCWPAGVPLILNAVDPIQILQDPNYVVILYRGDMQVRRISLNAQAPANIAPSWYGYSVGHYEGPNTLVVETTGQNDRALVDRFGTPRSESIRVVERYTISPDRSELRVEFTVEDPETFASPWSANVTYSEAPETFVERICAENNKNPAGGIFPIPEDPTLDF